MVVNQTGMSVKKGSCKVSSCTLFILFLFRIHRENFHQLSLLMSLPIRSCTSTPSPPPTSWVTNRIRSPSPSPVYLPPFLHRVISLIRLIPVVQPHHQPHRHQRLVRNIPIDEHTLPLGFPGNIPGKQRGRSSLRSLERKRLVSVVKIVGKIEKLLDFGESLLLFSPVDLSTLAWKRQRTPVQMQVGSNPRSKSKEEGPLHLRPLR